MARITVRVPAGPNNLQTLMKELDVLHRRAGRPSLRKMADGQEFSYGSVNTLFAKSATQFPRLDVLEAVVTMLALKARGADKEALLDDFNAMWVAAEEEFTQESPSKETARDSDQVVDLLDVRAGESISVGSAPTPTTQDRRPRVTSDDDIPEHLYRLKSALNELRMLAGNPSFRSIARDALYSPTTVYRLLQMSGKRVPSREIVLRVGNVLLIESHAHRNEGAIEASLEDLEDLWRKAVNEAKRT